MAKLTKKAKGLIAAIIVVALLGGALTVLLLTGGGDTDPDSSSADATSSATSVQLVDKEAKDVKNINIKNKKGSFDIVATGKEEWEIASLKGYEQLNTMYESIAEEASSVTAMKVLLETQENLAEYGLDEPQTVVVVTYTDGTTLQLNIGDATPDGNAYMTVEGKAPIYIYSNASTFDHKPYDFLDTTITESTDSDSTSSDTSSGSTQEQIVLERLEISRPDLKKPIILVENEGRTDEDQISLGTYKMISPVNIIADDEHIGNLATGILNLSGDAVEVLKPTAAQKKERGFDKPAAVVKAIYDGDTYVLRIGNAITCEATDEPDQLEEDHKHSVIGYNVMLDGKDIIYRVSESYLPWLKQDYESLASAFVVIPNILDVKRVTIAFDGKTYVFDLAHSKDEEDSDVLTATYNGKALNEDYFKSYYQLLLGLTQSGINTAEVKGSPIMTLQYDYVDSKKGSEKLEYFDSGTGSVIIRYNGEANFLTKYSTLNRIKNSTALIIENKEIDAN